LRPILFSIGIIDGLNYWSNPGKTELLAQCFFKKSTTGLCSNKN
jgi:hypothetical protein